MIRALSGIETTVVGTMQLLTEKEQQRKERTAAAFQRWKAKQIEAGTYKQKKEEYRIAYFTKKINNKRQKDMDDLPDKLPDEMNNV